MTDLGLDISMDGIGNVVGVRPGRTDGPPIMTGSHIDTVRTGGRFDGNLGVLAGLEVIETLEFNGITTEHPFAVAFFTDEEGARFQPDMLGSLVYAGGMGLEEALDVVGIDGTVLGEELDRIGYRGTSPCPGIAPRAFVELHVEQGPVLEADGVTIGAVTGVQGISWTELAITGQSNHAGTTPMHLRHDAGYVAAAIAAHVRQLAIRMGGRQVATVGSLELNPNLVNVVAGMRNVNQLYIRGAQSMGASRVDLFRHVIFPHMVPSFFAGLRLGMTMTLLGVILAELYVSTQGIGYYTKVFAETMDPAPLYAIIFLLAVIAITFNEIVRIAERRFTRWKA